MKTPSIKNAYSAIACALLLLFSSMTYAFESSDGSDGSLEVFDSISLVVPDTKTFNFTTFSILSGGILDFTGATSTDNIQILATGDVLIDGILNAMPSMLSITTPGSITINGTIKFGDALTLSASTISINGIIDGNFDIPEVTPGPITLAVPEPDSYGMLLVGLGVIGLLARRRQNS